MYKLSNYYLIWSEDYRKLADWYQKNLEFRIQEELNHPDDTGYDLVSGSMHLWIGKHSKVKGKSKDPYRHMLNIEVDSVSNSYSDLKSKGIDFIADPFKAPTYDLYFATFTDLDGNILQIVGGK